MKESGGTGHDVRDSHVLLPSHRKGGYIIRKLESFYSVDLLNVWPLELLKCSSSYT